MVRATYKEAEKCETSHMSVVTAKELEYQIGAYPYKVMVTFTDKKEIEYVMVEYSGR